MAGQDLHLGDTLGCTFIGVLFALLLYGCSCAQTLYYYQEYPKDTLFVKSLVFILWLLDTSRTSLDVAFLWVWTVTSHGDVTGLARLPNTFTAEFFLASLTVFIVQCYFIHTIWTLLEERWFQIPLTFLMVILSAVSFVGGVVTVYRINLNTVATVAVVDATIPASIQTVTAFVADMYITLSLCCILWGQRTGFKRTETLLHTLTIYAIHRGIFTGLIQLAHFTTYISTIHTDTLYWMLWHIPGSKIYVNSLLAVLNVRHHLREAIYPDQTDFSVDAFPLDTVQTGNVTVQSRRSRGGSRANASHTHITFTRSVIRDDDREDPEPGPDEDLSRKLSSL
ncbi:hypothetical protein WOLCODRAFT_135557 [Wolfiporia cocos MD-104 SS10]|uniref:DUF6534 domain-containing protein n=1 Tax=Wolfiporia cocos (strain MD-104) TaxID=742152 RepID=A0A2H3J961_WOLCO|nr:hypothetical protein WOLCODRAFT_135557 [Wolfiporia cocos MD-104 SS10]